MVEMIQVESLAYEVKVSQEADGAPRIYHWKELSVSPLKKNHTKPLVKYLHP